MAQKKQMGFQQNPQVTNKSDMNQKDSFMREKHAKGVLNYRHFQGKDYLEISISLNWSWKLSLKHDTEPLQCIPCQKQWKLRNLSTLAALLCMQQQGSRGFGVTEVLSWDWGESSFHPGSATNMLWAAYTHLFWLFKWQVPQQRLSQQKGSAHTSRDTEAPQGVWHNSLPWTWRRGLWGGAGSSFERGLCTAAHSWSSFYVRSIFILLEGGCRHTELTFSFPSLSSTHAGRHIFSF